MVVRHLHNDSKQPLLNTDYDDADRLATALPSSRRKYIQAFNVEQKNSDSQL